MVDSISTRSEEPIVPTRLRDKAKKLRDFMVADGFGGGISPSAIAI